MSNIRLCNKIANDFYQNAGGKNRPYKVKNGVWTFNGEELDQTSQFNLKVIVGLKLQEMKMQEEML